MKKTLMALALTLVAGSMIACGEAPPAANNANTMNKPTTAPVNKPTEMPAANSNMPAANSNRPMPANSNAK